jgi:hypothetical protein
MVAELEFDSVIPSPDTIEEESKVNDLLPHILAKVNSKQGIN